MFPIRILCLLTYHQVAKKFIMSGKNSWMKIQSEALEWTLFFSEAFTFKASHLVIVSSAD